MGLPGASGRPWHAREVWGSLGAIAVVVIAGIAAISKECEAEKPSWPLVALYSAGLVAGCAAAGLKVAHSMHKDKKDDKKESPDDIRGCLHVILRTVCGYKSVLIPPDGWMRIAVHRIDGSEFEQIVDYVGSGDGGAGRRLPKNAGLIGAALADVKKRSQLTERPVDVQYEMWVEYLVQKMNMPRDRARRARPDRFSFMAVPIPDLAGKISCVAFFDAGDIGFFDTGTQLIIGHACAGLAIWINERYYS